MLGELILDESQFAQLTHIESHYDSLRISNPSEIQVDAEALIGHLSRVKGTDHVKMVTIGYNSSLKDLKVVSAFTNLEILYVHGQHLQTLDGIEWFSRGEYINIETYRNRRRDISQLSQTKVKRMRIYVDRVEDISSIAGCKHLNTLELCNSMDFDLREWGSVPFEEISFTGCKFKELGDISAIPGLDNISVLGCRRLERFTGDNSNIKRLIVDGSNKLDLRTLATFAGIEVLIVNSCSKEMNLTDIGGLQHVKHIDFILCNVQVDLINLKEYFPNLESLHISGMKKEYGLQLKQLNPDVEITSRSFEL